MCGRLGQYAAYDPVDFCGLPKGHEGPHSGQYRHMIWEDPAQKGGKIRIIRSGNPMHNLPAE